MKNKVVLAIFLVMSFCANAQMEIDKMERLLLDKKDSIGIPSYKFLVNLSGDYSINSNSVTNRFLKSLLYRGDFIDESLKNRETERLKKSNRFGVDESICLQGIYKAKKLDYVFGVRQRVVAGSRFSSDFFELIFRGNSSYAGKQADLSGTNIRLFDYQSLFAGVQKELKNGKYVVGGSLSLIRGGNHVAMRMKEATLYTEPSGQYVEYNGDISFSRFARDTMGSSPLKSHGMGAGLNLSFSVIKDKGRWNFEVRDIGFISWKNVKNYHGDSTFRYNGVLLDDLLGDGSSIVSTVTVDSVAISSGLNIETKNTTMFLPTIFHVNYVMMPYKRFTRTVGIKYMLIPGYIPEIYIRGTDFLGKGFTLVTTVSYGGFGRFDYELGVMKKIKDSFIISANLFAFEYLVLPGKSSGHGFNVGLTKMF